MFSHTIYMYLFFALIFYFILLCVCTVYFKMFVNIVMFLWNSRTNCITGNKLVYSIHLNPSYLYNNICHMKRCVCHI